MTLYDTAVPYAPADSVPAQSRRPVTVPTADRSVRQVEAIAGWVTARRERERALTRSRVSRDERMDVSRELEVLRRTHDTIQEHCARALAAEVGPMCWSEPTAVLAHRHPWFRKQVALSLVQRGVTVVASTDNGAEALGAVVAEQPDLLLTGDRLVMMPGRVLLDEVGRFAKGTLRAVQVLDRAEAAALPADVDEVLAREHPPAVAEALVALHLRRGAGQDGTALRRLAHAATG